MSFKTAGTYIRRSPYQAFAASLIMTLTFFIISLFLLSSVITSKMITYFETVPQLSIFFKSDTKIDDIMQMKTRLEATGKTKSVKYISKEEAYKIYKEKSKDDPDYPLLIELVSPDILPASLDVQTEKAEYLNEIRNSVKDSPLIEKIDFQENIINTLITWTSAFRRIGIALIAVLLVESVIVIMTIIGMKIIVRREEIEIMRLIGATNWFIRFPFILEGAFYGTIGAIMGWVLSICVLMYFTPQIKAFFHGVPIFPLSPILLLEVLGVEAALAAIFGMFASYIAVLRYLK